MNAVLKPVEVRLEPFTPAHAAELLRIELRSYTFPWSLGNFVDSHRAGYHMQMLMAGREILGYFVAMQGVDEVHLLNITVAPEHQGQGWARLMLDALCLWTRGQGRQWLWLEVRQSNTRAIHLYQRYGFERVGLRKNYYPGNRAREDAVVMSLNLNTKP